MGAPRPGVWMGNLTQTSRRGGRNPSGQQLQTCAKGFQPLPCSTHLTGLHRFCGVPLAVASQGSSARGNPQRFSTGAQQELGTEASGRFGYLPAAALKILVINVSLSYSMGFPK